MEAIIPHASLQSTIEWHKRARPETTSKHFHAQTGCHFEEVGEMLEQLDSGDVHTAALIVRAEKAIRELAIHLKASDNVLEVKSDILFFDSICDQTVTGAGVAHTRNYDFLGGLGEVNGSNWSKFVDGQPVYDANMKVIKGPHYYKANLSRFV